MKQLPPGLPCAQKLRSLGVDCHVQSASSHPVHPPLTVQFCESLFGVSGSREQIGGLSGCAGVPGCNPGGLCEGSGFPWSPREGTVIIVRSTSYCTGLPGSTPLTAARVLPLWHALAEPLPRCPFQWINAHFLTCSLDPSWPGFCDLTTISHQAGLWLPRSWPHQPSAREAH